jgi:predicted nucleic acid-binding protein
MQNISNAAIADAGPLIHLDQVGWLVVLETFSLDQGEKAALALWRSHQDAILLCDDLQARTVAQDFGVPVMGTLGLILRAAQFSLRSITEVRTTLTDLPKRSTQTLNSPFETSLTSTRVRFAS